MAIRHREPLPGPARAAQAEDGGVGLHARVRRGAGQGLRRHRHREGLEPLRLRQRRHEAAATPICLRPIFDEATLIQYIDRFLMFYIRTADRLQRTSTWLENLEGGIDYLRKVVCEDSLGIGAELEADMQQLVDSYDCEWKKAIETPGDPEALPPFREQRRARQRRGVRRRARPDPPGAAGEREPTLKLHERHDDPRLPRSTTSSRHRRLRAGRRRAGRRFPTGRRQVHAIGNRDPFSRRQRPLARHRRRPQGRAGRGLAGLQAAFQPSQRALHRGRHR